MNANRASCLLVWTCLGASACGDDGEGPSLTDANVEEDAGDGNGEDDFDAGLGTGSLGDTSRVRVANTVPGVSLDVWVADTSRRPVRVAQDIASGSISEYFTAPVNTISQDPEFVLLPSGEQPTGGATWQVVSGPDRAFITVNQLDGAEQSASVIVSLDDDTGQLQAETLDETELMVGSETEANLHIHYGLFDLQGDQAIAFAVAGMDCFQQGSTSVSQVFSVPPGNFEFAVYDVEDQIRPDCTTAPKLASAPLEVMAGGHELVVTYLDGDAIEIVTAPIVAR